MLEFIAVGTFLVLVFNAIETWKTKHKVVEVHNIVNSNAEKQEKFIEDLTHALTDAGVPVPKRNK